MCLHVAVHAWTDVSLLVDRHLGEQWLSGTVRLTETTQTWEHLSQPILLGIGVRFPSQQPSWGPSPHALGSTACPHTLASAVVAGVSCLVGSLDFPEFQWRQASLHVPGGLREASVQILAPF